MKHLVCIAGPTAVGKTALSVALARHYQTVIVSADSRQIYRFMDIGTAKPNLAERKGIAHYFIDHLSPDQDYSAGKYESEAETLLELLFEKYQVIICVGGSTLYFDALWNGMDDMPAIPADIRQQLNREFRENGLAPLVGELQEVDAETYQSIDRSNPARIIRAIEVYRTTGKPISWYRNRRSVKTVPYNLIKIGLMEERKVLYGRINQRVMDMIDQGLVAEVKSLLEKGYSPHTKALQSIGYQEVIDHLQGSITLEEAIRLIQRNSRRYAKRQITWFRRYRDLKWFQAGNNEAVIAWVDSIINAQ